MALAAPLFIVMVFCIFIPWLLWGFSIRTERLHDYGKSAWRLAIFYGLPTALGQMPKMVWFGGAAGTALYDVPELGALALAIGGFFDI